MKKMKVMSLIMVLVIAVAIFAGCNANPSTESGYTQEEIDALQVANEILQGSLNNLRKEFDGLQTAKNVLQSDLDVLTLESDALKEEIEALRIENGTLQITIDELAVSSAAPPAPSSSSSASAASSSASSKPASSVPASSAPASSSTASAVQTASSAYVGAKDECYPINEGGKWYIVLCNKIPAAVAGRKDTITSDVVGCGSCGVKINRAGQIVSGSSGSGGTSSGSSGSTSTVDTAALANEVMRLINKERVSAGLSELSAHSSMASAADVRAKEHANNPELKHIRPDGTSAADLAAAYSSGGYGLEIIMDGGTSASEVVKVWMASKGHKDTILSPNVTDFAAGCYQKESGRLYWAVLFVN